MNASPSAARPNRVGVCTWSLRPSSCGDLVAKLRTVGISHIQLALDPVRTGTPGWGEIETLSTLRSAGITIASGMMGTVGEDYSTLETIKATGGIRVSKHWGENLRATQDNVRLARRLGIPLITFHAGFIPHERTSERRTMLDRLRAIIDHADDSGIRIGFETGQESAATLLDALHDLNRPHAGINFDPANMILYGMGDPIAALNQLAPRIIQLHIKDATPTATPGQWGTEVPVGTGAVRWPDFFQAVRTHSLAADLMIEREARDQRETDIRTARDLLLKHGFAS